MTNFRTAVLHLDRAGDPNVFAEDVRQAAAEMVARYPAGQSRSALLPMLHLVQAEQGYVSADGIAFCAGFLGLSKAQVAAVVTFYTMFKRAPTGEYLVSVCTNTLCGVMGGDEIYESLSKTLGVGMNETTADGTITLEHAECLAACDYAPVVTVNYEFFDNQSVESAQDLVGKLRAGERPRPTRGAPLCSFKEVSRQIAGFADDRPSALEAEATGVPTEIGVRLAVERAESAPSYAISREGETGTDEAAAARAAQQPTSAHDAPLQTAAGADTAETPAPTASPGASASTAGGGAPTVGPGASASTAGGGAPTVGPGASASTAGGGAPTVSPGASASTEES
jgi:NADH-quinone oxidoreductase subunit E